MKKDLITCWRCHENSIGLCDFHHLEVKKELLRKLSGAKWNGKQDLLETTKNKEV